MLVSIADQSTRLDTTLGTTLGKSISDSSLQRSKNLVLPSVASLQELKDTEPGPGQYPLPSSLGPQLESTKDSGPAAPMLAKNAKSWNKVFLGKQQQNIFLCRDSPGAVYNPKVLSKGGCINLGKTVGRAARSFETISPGPIYKVREDISKSCRSASMGYGERKQHLVGDPHIDCGPGTYDVPTFIDNEHLSKSFGIGYGDYPPLGSELVGRTSPGPGFCRYDFGKNLPQYRFSGKVKFGTGSRPRPRRNTNPPPGAYNAHKQYSVAKDACIDSQVWNYRAHRFGKPSMKPRMDLKRDAAYKELSWMMN
jgi:hypothetical protein